MQKQDVPDVQDVQNLRGRFIVIEGVDGSGISTQVARLHAWLEERTGCKVLATKEPSEGPAGLVLRQALNKRLQGFSQEVLALLFAADRLDHVNHQIRPALDQGSHVICDRYLWSSLAYQGESAGGEWVEAINAKALKPDLTLFVRVEPEITMARIRNNRFQVDLFEQEAFLKRVLARFEHLVEKAQAEGETVAVIDGSMPIESVATAIQDRVQAFWLDKQSQF